MVSATITYNGEVGGAPLAVDYQGGGLYAVTVSPVVHGPFVVNIRMGDFVYVQDGVGRCGEHQMDGADGSCLCAAGYEPNANLEACIPCNSDQEKKSSGNHKCSDKPPNFTTIIAGSVSGAVAFLLIVLAFALMHGRHLRLLKERDTQLERDFMSGSALPVRLPSL